MAAAETVTSVVPLSEVYTKLQQQDPEWLETTLRHRWQQITDLNVTSETAQTASKDARSVQQASLGAYDITSSDISPTGLSEHLLRFRSHDWASTELGPMSAWSSELRRMINLCMADPRPVALWWGPNRILLHNEAYRAFLQERYEWALGKSVAEVWHDVPSFPNNFDVVDATAKPVFGEDTLFFVKQEDGHFEEVWASFVIVPLPGVVGNVGYYNSCSLNTRQIIYERRMSTLLALERHTSLVETVDDFWTKVLQGLKPNHADIPFAALYSNTAPLGMEGQFADMRRAMSQSDISSHSEVDASSVSSGEYFLSQWTLQGSLESAPDQLRLPQSMTLEIALETFGELFKVALNTRVPQVLRLRDGTFPKSLQSRAISRAYGDLCDEAILIPIVRGHRKCTAAFLFLGLNSRACYDEDYQKFTSMLRRQLATSMNSVIMHEEEARHAKMSAELAARDHMHLAEKLNLSEQDAQVKEMRFRSMADQAPIPMFECQPNGEINYVNDSWYALTGHPRNDYDPFSWTKTFHPDDRAHFATHWNRLVAGETVNFEMRLAKPFVSDEYIGGERLQGETWVSAFSYAEKDPSGLVRNVLGCLVDISQYKWMQSFQERRTADALELKRQQEAFMDMTSHEARNPLSAISLCVESIISSLQTILEKREKPDKIMQETIETTLESAETIMGCVAHQKCIIDDVLTVSKLGSGLLVVSPIEMQPKEELGRALKLFEGELKQSAIEFQYVVDPSYQDLNIDWVLLDPTRLLQILINLLTNAIKFTKDEATRRITITMSASHERPESKDEGVQYMPNAENTSPSPQEDDSSTIYLRTTVEDTGRGIEHEDLCHLFQRFQQGSPKTHVKYGGSGLGLYICKELARLQGGQIGVSTTYGEGSTFAFFLKAKLCESPQAIEHAQKQEKTAQETKAEANEGKKQMKHILLVEDNLVNQKVMAKQLRSANYTVTVANHGQEALDHLLTTHFCKSSDGADLDLVLMDIEMPVMGGLECSKRIREMEEKGEVKGRVPLIAVTANARAEQQREATNAGFDAVVTKPFRMRELVVEMEKF